MNTRKLVIAVERERLEEYGFFYHRASNAWWYVFHTTKDNANVELSLRLYDDNDEMQLFATNDHIKLPSMYNPRYNKDNYLQLEEELDKFSFEEWIKLGIFYDLISDGIIKISKKVYNYKKPRTPKVEPSLQDILDKQKDSL